MSDRANRVKALFLAALEKPPAERAVLLDEACAGDNALRQRVEALLRACSEPDSLRQRPAVPAGASVGPAPRGDPEEQTISGATGPAGPESAAAVELPPRYRLDREIARGGMGAVLRGRDTDLGGREIAVKVLLQTHADRAELVQRFVEEAQIAGQLQHPGVAPVYELGRSGDKRPYFTMKLVKGQTLARLLAQRAGPSADRPRLLTVFEAVCQTVAYAHDKGVIHRDLKPSNIMVGNYGEVLVMDWGLAKVLGRDAAEEMTSVVGSVREEDDARQTGPGTALGTPAYMAPEQARGEVERVDERADVFGLGAILCEILTGKPPFAGKSAEAMQRARQADLAGTCTRLDACGADAELVALARACLSAEPDQRPRHAGAVAFAVTAHLESVQERLRQAELAAAEARARAVEQRKRRRLKLALAASLLVTLLLAGGGYGWVRQQRAQRHAALTQAVNEALERAAVLRGTAEAVPLGDLSGWAAAQAEAKRAEDLLAADEADLALRRRVSALRAELEQGRAEAERRAADDRAERRLAADLEAVRAEVAEHWSALRADQAYAEAFRAFGLDVDALEPQQVAAKLAGRPATAEVAAALDHWGTLRRIYLTQRKDVRSWHRLVEVARAADPDPWRNGLRAAFGRPLPEATAALKRQAGNAAALRRQPAASLVLLSSLLHRVGEKEWSAAVLRSAWQRFPGDFWINHELGGSSWTGSRHTRPDEAVRYLTAAVAARPRSSMALNNLGNALSVQGKLNEAAACFHRALALDPKSAVALSNLGGLLAKQGKKDEALACLRRALELDPNLTAAHNNLGLVLRDRGKAVEAIACLRKAIALNPGDSGAHMNLGVSLGQKGKWDEAIACLRTAATLDASNPHTQHNLAVALTGKGLLDEAFACRQKTIALDPKWQVVPWELVHALVRHGNALSRKGNVDEAIACHQKAIVVDATYALAHYNLANALGRKGRLADAVASYRKCLALDPDYPEAHCNLAEALRRQGRLAESLESYRRGHALGSKRSGWSYPSAQWVRETERLALVEKKLLDVLCGQVEPANAAERDEYLHVCRLKGRHEWAARLYARAFAANPKLEVGHRCNAAREAALAVAGKGADNLDDSQRARWRRQALTWLKEALALHRESARTGKPADRAAVHQAMQSWQQDADLVGLRGSEALDKLPAAERRPWQDFWADVASLLRETTQTPVQKEPNR
jgi:serine/threonine-protein kinase